MFEPFPSRRPWWAFSVALSLLVRPGPGSCAQAAGETYAPPSFGHYQPILDRMPFGALPADFNAAPVDAGALKSEAEAKAQQQQIADKIKLSAINITPDGATAIGFTDTSVTPPVYHYLRVGESESGWTVVCADFDAETASLEKDGITVPMNLRTGLMADAPPPPAAANPAAAAMAALRGNLPPSAPALLPAAPLAGLPAARSLRPPVPTAARSALPIPARPIAAGAPPVMAAEEPAPALSYADRQRERLNQKTQEQQAAEAKLKEQFEKLARETAKREIQRQQAAALAAEQAAAQEEEAHMQEQQLLQEAQQQVPADAEH